jgi:hypothetical protein
LIHLNNPADPVNEITRVKYLGQLEKAEVHHRILLVDGGQGTKADWISRGYDDRLLEFEQGWRVRDGKPILRYGEPVTFVIRLEDGNLVIPPGRKLDPEGML